MSSMSAAPTRVASNTFSTPTSIRRSGPTRQYDVALITAASQERLEHARVVVGEGEKTRGAFRQDVLVERLGQREDARCGREATLVDVNRLFHFVKISWKKRGRRGVDAPSRRAGRARRDSWRRAADSTRPRRACSTLTSV